MTNSSKIKSIPTNTPVDQSTDTQHSDCDAAHHKHKHDDKHIHDHSHDHHHEHDHSSNTTDSRTTEPMTLTALADSEKTSEGIRTSIRIMQMDCPTEETLIRKKLNAMSTVKSMEFNLIQRVLTVVHEPNALQSVLDAVRSLGFEPQLPDTQGQLANKTEPKKHWWPLAIAVVAAICSEAIDWLSAPEWLSASMAILAIIFCGLSTYKKGWIAIRNGNLNINALMSIAVTGAFILGQWPEAAMVMVLFTIAELIEAKSLDRARNAIEGLMKLTPEKAIVQQDDGSWKEIEAKDVRIESIVRVKPGERIALDGILISGYSSVDQAPITGESLPVDKTEGDAVFAGTINQSGSFDYKVTATTGGSTLARIIKAIEEAQGARAPTQQFVDKFSRIYTPTVFAISLAIAILPPIIMGGGWQEWIYKALVLLVIACPCALVISTPVTIVSGLAAAARKGILIKGGIYLEEGRKLKWLALDKTGTITYGKPVQTDFKILNNNDENYIFQLAFSLAGRSDHPVSMAVAKAAEDKNILPLKVEEFTALLGRGVRGNIDGKTFYLGNHRTIEEIGCCSNELETEIDILERQGKTVVMLADDSHVLALFAVADTIKETSNAAIKSLHELGIKTMMLTGDNTYTAEAIARQVNIDQARGGLLPEDKLSAIVSLSEEGVVGMVGDGINDAPALARADIGFAMGAMGTDTAIETADVALMDDDLQKIPTFVRLSRKTHSILVQNITLALSIKAIFLVLTLTGSGTMWMAVFADVGASLLVVTNGLRSLRA